MKSNLENYTIEEYPNEKMRKLLFFVSLIVILTTLFTGSFWYLLSSSISSQSNILSPIPDFLTLSKNNQVRILDLWSPVVEKIYGSEGELDELSAKGIMMYDLTTNKQLYGREVKVRRPMASLTKIMTAIIALENQKTDNKYYVKASDLVGEDSMGLSDGEVLPLEELLYGLMLPSGNDAAEVLAHNFSTGRMQFIQAMNNKAVSLGLKDTHFSNPSGLQGDGEQYTTPFDLVVMTRYALENYPLLRKIVSTVQYEIPASAFHKSYNLQNETNLLTTYPGVKGVKTGYTPEAGMSLVTYLEYDNHKIIGVILNSQNRRGEMKNLLDYSLKTLGITPPPFEEST